MGSTYLWLREKLNKTDNEIKKMTVAEINMLIQRSNEPMYKKEIDEKLIRNKNG